MEEIIQKQELEKEPAKVIPSLSFNKDELVIDTVEVPLNVDDKEIKITMRKLTAGERRAIVKKTSPIKVVGTQHTGSIDTVGYQICILSKVIIDAPFKVTEELISSFPTEVLDYLFQEYTTFAENKKKG